MNKHSKMIAGVIESRMLDKGLSKIEFSKLMDVQPSVVTKWLSGKHNFTIKTITKIESRLHVGIISVVKKTKL